jgi:hypothetical protein
VIATGTIVTITGSTTITITGITTGVVAIRREHVTQNLVINVWARCEVDIHHAASDPSRRTRSHGSRFPLGNGSIRRLAARRRLSILTASRTHSG